MVGEKQYDSLRAVTYVRTSKIYRPQIFITQIVVQLSFLQRKIKAFLNFMTSYAPNTMSAGQQTFTHQLVNSLSPVAPANQAVRFTVITSNNDSHFLPITLHAPPVIFWNDFDKK